METIGIIDVFLGPAGNLCHRFNCFDRVVTGCRLTRKHNRTGAVVDSVCDVGNFGTGRTEVVNHRFQHFSCSNDPLAKQSALGNQHLLDTGQLLVRNLDAHVTTADHDAVTLRADLFDICHTRTVFDLGNQVDILAAADFIR